MTASDEVIRVAHVSKSFSDGSGRSVEVLRDISLEVREGKFVCLVGPSGCGKTTLLNMMAGMVVPSQGHVFYRGAVVKSINSNAGYITQRDNLLPWRTVEKNVELVILDASPCITSPPWLSVNVACPFTE